MKRDAVTRRRFMGVAAGAAAAGGLDHAAMTAGAAAGAQERSSGTYAPRVREGEAYDVAVCGGGPAGVAAAVAAARGGMRVLLVDGAGQLGGNGTSGLVSHWLGGRMNDCERWAVGGIFKSLCERAAEEGIALIPTPDPAKKYQPHGWHQGQLAAGIPFDPFRMAWLLDRAVAEAGVDVLLLTQAVDVVAADGRITHVVLFNKSGFTAVLCKAMVDATGDADMAARSGCGVTTGRDEDGLMTPASLMFHVDHVDQAALDAYIHEKDTPRFREEITRLREQGAWPFPYEIFISVQLDAPGTMMINTTRLVGIDGTDGASLTRCMQDGRQEIKTLLKIMREHIAGFENVRLKAVAQMPGIRETRRILGPRTLRVEDIAAGKDFDDCIGFSSYGWDLPDPKEPSKNPSHGKKREVTPIPYGVMLPDAMANLICPGRAVNVERPVLGPLRVMAPCMAMGEAAGAAAAMAVNAGAAFAEVDTAALREALARQGAVVEWEEET